MGGCTLISNAYYSLIQATVVQAKLAKKAKKKKKKAQKATESGGGDASVLENGDAEEAEATPATPATEKKKKKKRKAEQEDAENGMWCCVFLAVYNEQFSIYKAVYETSLQNGVVCSEASVKPLQNDLSGSKVRDILSVRKLG